MPGVFCPVRGSLFCSRWEAVGLSLRIRSAFLGNFFAHFSAGFLGNMVPMSAHPRAIPFETGCEPPTDGSLAMCVISAVE